MEVLLDGRCMTDREMTHIYLAEMLSLPGYYGKNLDALFDLLTDYADYLDIIIVHVDVMIQSLGNYGQALFDTIYDAAHENPKIKISICNEINKNSS